MEDRVILLGILGAIISPIVTAIGLFLQYKKDLKKEESEQVVKEAEAKKIEADAHALDTKVSMDQIKFYVDMVNTLRDEVSALTDMGRRNNREIEILTSKLLVADDEKRRLAIDKQELLSRISRYEVEVKQLRAEVESLRNKK